MFSKFKNHSRTLLFATLIAAMSICGCDRGTGQTLDPTSNSNANQQQPGEMLSASLTINLTDQDADNITFAVKSNSSITVLDLLQKASQSREFDIDYSGKGETAFVKSINGIVGGTDGRGWWIYFVNNKLAHKGAGVYKLQDGDQVEWRLGNYTSIEEIPLKNETQTPSDIKKNN